ncbi:ABC transporter permease [Geochorda subterranea]|uniref:ABC transporter permease n=1 Tax=Geochorda subterranea TaxID=3109564 RepID=A0ABZ1BMA1_9FIRM|nr:ABC transporter permease [Limnochorda sp. LNt]WRP13591.1 ABC transporter permease [Limnochorda sp. LNt]
MIRLVARRLMMLPLVLVGTSLIIFALSQLLSPYQRVATYVRSPQELKSFTLDELVRKYQLDAPLTTQYANWLRELAGGHLGWSEVAKEPVWDAIVRHFPATLELTLYASIPMAVGGVWLGTLAAVRHNSWVDHASRVFAIVGWSFPTFVFGLLFLMVFYGWLGWFPPGRLSVWATQAMLSPDFRQLTGLVTIDAVINGRLDILVDALRHMVGPVVTLSYLYWAQLQRITRSSMLDTLRQDYVRTARAKGLDERSVIRRHARRNALIPVSTVIALMVLGLLGGVVITETIFAYPGIGRLLATAALQLDRATVLGVTLFYAVILVLVILAMDISYALIDPRVRIE